MLSARLDETRSTLRFNALVACVLGFACALLLLLGKLPFPNKVGWFSLFSSCCYLCYFVFFDRICRSHYRAAGIALSQIGSLIISVSIYFSGGVVSPLPFLYMAILVSEAIYGLENWLTVPVSAAGYLTVVWGIYSGLLPNPAPWSAHAYEHLFFPVIMSTLLLSYLAVTKNLSDKIIRNLRADLVRESGEKDVLLKKFAELNATAQLGVLAHRIAHDLRGPLGSISGYIQIESAKPCSEEQTQTLRDLEDVVNNMSGSLRNITRFGRADAVNREKIDLSAFMDSLLAIISFYPQSGGVAFRRSYPRGGLAVFASRADLQQAYFNILKNAVEAVRNNPGEKEVEVSVRPTSAGLEVAIADNGPGILPEIAASLFKKSVSTKKDGTGVGLMITRDLLQRNDASIELRERNGGGTAAVTLIPAA